MKLKLLVFSLLGVLAGISIGLFSFTPTTQNAAKKPIVFVQPDSSDVAKFDRSAADAFTAYDTLHNLPTTQADLLAEKQEVEQMLISVASSKLNYIEFQRLESELIAERKKSERLLKRLRRQNDSLESQLN